MDKTLHKKLTENHLYTHSAAFGFADGDDMLAGLVDEMKMLRQAAKDLLQPRQEAIASIMKLSRTI